MVMATGSVCPPYGTGDMSHEAAEGSDSRDSAAAALHERLVAFVHALTPAHEARTGVWGEHSYARARGSVANPPSSNVRVLLAPPTEPPDLPGEEIDVEKEDPPPPSPPESRRLNHSQRSPSDTEDEVVDEDWEARVTAIAPSAAHATLAELALDILRRIRLARLACGRSGAREHERLAARRLRHALVAAASAPGPHTQRPGPWLHATLLAYMPRSVRRIYDTLTSELRRAAPRLAERMMGVRAPPPRRDPLAVVGPPIGPDGPVWLIWLGSGSEKQDRRWRRRFSTLVHTRVLPAATVGPARPEAWCAAVAGAMRAALADTLNEAGDRAVILGGAGMGASLCIALASGVTGTAANAGGTGGVRGLLLLAPPLLTAEGPRDSPDDPLAEIRLPMLMVSGAGASQSWRGIARAVCRGREARRLLEVRGADDALRACAHVRRRRRLPQHALDAAIADECARWAIETAERAPDTSPPRSPPRVTRRRADARAAHAHAPPPLLHSAAHDDDDDYDILINTTTTSRLERPIEGVSAEPMSLEGHVSRGSGATPLSLFPPRRGTGATPPPSLAAADIMRLPIVFADDDGVPSATYRATDPPVDIDAATPESPVTVTSGDSVVSGVTWRGGSGQYTRVIVASRGGSRAASRGGAVLTRGGAAVVTRGGGAVVTRGGSTVLTRGAVMTRGGGTVVTRGGSAVVTRGGGAVVTRGAVMTRGGGAVVMRGGSTVVTRGGSTIVTRGGVRPNLLMRRRLPQRPVEKNQHSKR